MTQIRSNWFGRTILVGAFAAAPALAVGGPKATAALVLTNEGIGKVAPGFTGGLAELRAALPGLDVREAVIKDEDGRESPGYEVHSGRELRFTLIGDKGKIYLDSKPGLKTSDGLAIGASFEQLAAIKHPHTCVGFSVFNISVVCKLSPAGLVYVFDDLKDQPQADEKQLEGQLRAHKIGHVRWVGKGDLAVPKVAATTAK
ncbi:hypothetical protein BH11MYX1_BH11MYX1_37220 [soil metagenome]